MLGEFRVERAVLLLVAIVVLRASTLFVPVFCSDEACIALQAQTIVRGGELYQDTADRKPPAVPYIYAATFEITGTASLIAVHIVAMLFMWLTALALVLEAGEAAAWLFVGASVAFLPADMMAANFEIFMLLPAVMAMWLARRHAFAAGVCVALAALCKQTALVMVIPVATRVMRREHWNHRWGGIVAMLAGCTAVLAAAALRFGPHDLYFWNVSGNAGYLAVDGFLDCVLPQALGVTLGFVAMWAGIWWLVARAWPRRSEHADWWVWLVANALAVAAGLRFLGHYYLHLLPAAAALAGAELVGLPLRARRRVVGYTAALALVGALAGFFGRQIHNMPDYRPLADEIRHRTQPSDHVMVWGNYPEILWDSERPPTSRFVHMHFVTGFSPVRPVERSTIEHATPGAYHMLLDDLTRHPPALWIDTSPANMRDYGTYPVELFPEIARYREAHFALATVIHGIAVYQRVR